MDDIKKLDLYELLGVLPSAENKEIKSAYRKKALTCHPDKNPDPEASKLFDQLKKGLELLLDEAARAAYDTVLKARQANKLRNQKLDSQRKKLKEELEEKELLAEQSHAKQTAEEQLQREIERLRKQASKEVEEEAERVRQLIAEQANERVFSLRRIQIRWKADKDDPTNGGYNENNLKQIFSKYGQVEAIVISRKKKGSALIEFCSADAAKRAHLLETGHEYNQLKIKILGTDNSTVQPPTILKESEIQKNNPSNTYPTFPCFSFSQSKSNNFESSNDLSHFEATVLAKLREAQAKKDLMKNAMGCNK